ncbi:DUF3653 domain-containing protein [Stenotrophomonas sp. CFBP 13725]|uniref:DUF3653 domain-containing protein n=1 Tax=Stenotrophomonas sp. CFBP 13725 TaxID=2775297 RepID=UPI001781FDBD|nr:DUF3653 domain-containing protein [Stenotrophomonas sp. CFBP 13725]MBD8634466.1 hypothetical protein [Stenotrophomonas sp. CFBP 13725]
MSKMDPHDRVELTGHWAGFGFQAGKMFTPEGHSLEPCDMTWWSLTCNIAREWRLMMAEARSDPAIDSSTCARNCDAGFCHRSENVINLRDAIRRRREKRLGVGDRGPGEESSNVVQISRGPKPRQRV